jgi:hypothetical protein
VILDADCEQLVIDHLAATLPLYGITAPVGDRTPGQGQESVVVIRTGGTRRDLVTDQAQLTIDVRAADNSLAFNIINHVRALLLDLWGRQLAGHAVYQVTELSGPYSNPTSTDLHRYSQSFLVAVRSIEVVV